MRLMKGDMWESGADVIVVTGNATVRNDGCLVMGRGAAWQATQRYPTCALDFGRQIASWKRTHPEVPYCMLLAVGINKPMLGLFQVKYQWHEHADLDLISKSTQVMQEVAALEWGALRIALNFPGIGNGRLARADVLPVISRLPDNVEVWERP